jgi:ATP-binding cassette, subfamily B, bacterial PglK
MKRLLLVRLWRHLSPRRRKQFLLLSAAMVLSAFAEVVSLGAVLPFLAVLTNPEGAFSNPIVARFAVALGITTPDQMLLPLTIAFGAAAITAGIIRIAVLWGTTRLAHGSAADLSIAIYRRTLYQPYQVHVSRNSSQVISGITNKVGAAVNVLSSVLMLASSAVLLIVVTTALVALDPRIALTAAMGFGLGYGVITLIARRRLKQNSARIARELPQVVKALQEGLGGIRDVLLDGTQPIYCEVYRRADQPLRVAQGMNVFIAQSPRYAMEAVGMLVIAFLAMSLADRPGGVAGALPVLGALALGAQRLLPALQQSYGAWADIAGNQASLKDTLTLLDQPVAETALLEAPPPLPLLHSIRVESVRFQYTPDGSRVLDDVNLVIPRGSRIGFVGITGSGKSTLMDLLMGLLPATEGRIIVDGEPLTGTRLRAWQRSVAHVPQHIFLSDNSIAENIAFGVPRDRIDMDRVCAVARQAQIADFIESRPEGYNVSVGERGVRLSGGQRQRLGIARALYKEATVLVLDEATSALDNATEQSVMSAIDGLTRELTVLIIAHRLTTVERCDSIVELEQGRVVAQGTYQELLRTSPSFRSMARAVA